MAAPTLNILHLTDLHMGQPNEERSFQTMWEGFFEDLNRCYRKSGPWDLIIFSGDLAFSGTSEQYKRVDQFLADLQKHLRTLGSREPLTLAVPGNHDLRRPSNPADPISMVFSTLTTLPDVQATKVWNEIVDDPNSTYRKSIEGMFTAYSDWWRPRAEKARSTVPHFVEGILPGEFAAEVQKDGARFAIVGLNSTFLQVNAGDFYEKLALDARQFFRLLPTHARDWLQQMDACLLITHQPPSWLAESNRAKVFSADIAKAGRFAVHLCGHEHVAKTHTESRDGSPARRIGLGRSLLALEPTEDRLERLMGYQSWRIVINRKEGRGSIRYWPRKAEQRGSGNLSFSPDQSFDLDEDEGTEELPESFFRCPNYRSAARRNEVSLMTVIDKPLIGEEFEKSFFINGWPERSQLLSDSISRAQQFANNLEYHPTSRPLDKPGDDILINHEVALGLKYDQELSECVHQYNLIVQEMRTSISEYNRLLYPLTDRFFIDAQTRGFGKFLDKEWNDDKQKEEDDYYSERHQLLREIHAKYELGADATVGDIRASAKYQGDLTKLREQLWSLVDKLLKAKKQIDVKIKYYDVALANQRRN
jgi:hypothetical protein